MKYIYNGNCPLTRAIYSFRTVPAMNSSVSCRALSAVKGRIIKPDVKRSNLFTAAIEYANFFGKGQSRTQHTVNVIIAKFFNQNFLQGVSVITTSSVHGLKVSNEVQKRRGRSRDGRTMLPGLSTTMNCRSLS